MVPPLTPTTAPSLKMGAREACCHRRYSQELSDIAFCQNTFVVIVVVVVVVVIGQQAQSRRH